MTPAPLQPMMPTGANFAAKAGLPPIPPMPPHGPTPQAPMPAMPPPAGGPQPLTAQSPGMAGVMPAAQPPPAPEPQPNLVPQEDGTLAVMFPTPTGGQIISQIFPKPKIPKALTQQAPPAQ